jgi:uncharacterized membrane protein
MKRIREETEKNKCIAYINLLIGLVGSLITIFIFLVPNTRAYCLLFLDYNLKIWWVLIGIALYVIARVLYKKWKKTKRKKAKQEEATPKRKPSFWDDYRVLFFAAFYLQFFFYPV